MSLQQFIRFCLATAIASGVFQILDGAFLDVAAPSTAPAKVLGGAAIALGIIGVTGLYLCERERRPCRHLDTGYVLSMFAFAAVSGISFARNFVLDELDDATVDALTASGPTLPALIAAGTLAGIGFIAFGTALIRHGFDPAGSWGYTVLLPASGFAPQLPVAAVAVLQGVAGLAVVRLGVVGLRHLANSASAGGPEPEHGASTSRPAEAAQ